MKQLILSWCNYTWNNSKIFVKSLRDTGYKGDIVFVDGTQDEFTLSKYKEYKVSILPCGKEMKDIVGVFLSFLINNEDVYNKVFTSDVRDVVFQSNPFDYVNDYNLHLVSEDLKIKEQHLNVGWIKQDYGSDILAQIENETIICAGTTYGGIESVITLIEKMLIQSPKNHQAMINYLVRTGKIEAIVEPNDGHSVVWTIGTKIDTEHDDFYKIQEQLITTIDDDFYKIQKPIITTLDDVIPPVIHQYDRHPRIRKMLEFYYADN